MDLSLAGRRALVTGGSKGLGRAIALELAAEGAHVALCSRNEAETAAVVAEIRAAGGRAFGRRADVTAPGDCDALVAWAGNTMGGLDIVVNNAGGARPGRFESLADDDWHDDLDTKLFSIIRIVRAALPYLKASDQARVINIGAVQAKSPDPVFCATTTIRAAGMNLTKALAMQYGPDGILFNSVHIGLVLTPQWENIRRRTAPHQPLQAFLDEKAATDVPLGRFGRVDEVSGLVTFLAGARSSYLTGTVIDVAGGMGRYV